MGCRNGDDLRDGGGESEKVEETEEEDPDRARGRERVSRPLVEKPVKPHDPEAFEEAGR